MDWLWKNVLSNLLAYAIWLVGAAIVAALVALKGKNVPWIAPALYGLATFTLLILLFAAFAVIAALRQQTRSVSTPETIEVNVRTWLDNFQFKSRKLDQADFHFAFEVNTEGGRIILLGRPKKHERYLFFQADVATTPEAQKTLATLSKESNEKIGRKVALELARFRIGWANLTIPITTFRLTKLVPITDSFTEGTFVQTIDEMESAIIVALVSLKENLDAVTPAPAVPSPK